ncbi:MAG TPA: flagellar basal body-associated FliL family protein [Stellaceae bacterium]|jgi:flagellar basal body-associated protein FliL|nr:flagellar basal body-associated FliL family protein [Stellaceae bacterium]
MTDIDQALDLDVDEEEDAPKRRGWLKLMILGLVGLLVVGGAGGAVWYFLLGGKAYLSGGSKVTETPLPYFLEMKPFVVSVPSKAGPSRFVQLGLSLELPGSASGALVTAILPQAQDALRQSVLAYKADDLQTQDGLEKVRASMLASLNKALLTNLGAERIAKAAPGKPTDQMVRAIYFSQLIVE